MRQIVPSLLHLLALAAAGAIDLLLDAQRAVGIMGLRAVRLFVALAAAWRFRSRSDPPESEDAVRLLRVEIESMIEATGAIGVFWHARKHRRQRRLWSLMAPRVRELHGTMVARASNGGE